MAVIVAGRAARLAAGMREDDDLARLRAATEHLDAPFALVDLDAFHANAADLVARAAGRPIRLASKSLRCRALMDAALARDGFRGVLAFTLPEALWLHDHGLRDIVVAYPTVDRVALQRLGGDADAASGSDARRRSAARLAVG